MSEVKLNGLYRHYRTQNVYTPLALVKNTGDGQDDKMMVLYYSFANRELFTRPLSEFVAKVQVNTKDVWVPRFQLLGEESHVR